MADAQAGFDTAVLEWEEGYRRLQATRADPARHRMLARVATAVGDEVRKQLGSRFTISELVGLYRERGDLLCDLGMATLPPGADLTDVSAACDGAFYLYMREAQDFGGGDPPASAGPARLALSPRARPRRRPRREGRARRAGS